MSDTIIIAAVGEYSDRETVRTIGVSTRAYHDPDLASTIEDGVFLPCLDGNSVSWSEQIRHQPQGGTTSVQVSDLTLINTEGAFDAWARYVVAGLEWTVKCGRPDQSWDEFKTIFAAVATGAPEFRGRTEMTIRLRDKFAALSQPCSTTVFAEDIPNERFAGRLAPVVYGDVQQVGALVIDPPFYRVYAALNLGIIRRITEGGRPTRAWTDALKGYLVTQSAYGDTLPISADIGGPPLPDVDRANLLDSIGGFDSWTSGAPDGVTVVDSPPDSSITEDVSNGGAIVVAGLGAANASTDLNASAATRTATVSGPTLTAKDAADATVFDLADWPALIDADDAARVIATFNAANTTAPRLTLTGFGSALASTDTVSGVTVSIRAQKTSGTGPVEFSEVRLLLPNGSVSEDKSAATVVDGTKTLHTFGGSSDQWGLTLTPGIVNSSDFGVRISLSAGSPGTFPTLAEIFEVILTVHTSAGNESLKLYFDVSATTGDRYQPRVTYDDLGASPSDSISVRWAFVEAAGDPIPALKSSAGSTGGVSVESLNNGDPAAITEGQLVGSGVFEGDLVADGPVFAVEFFAAPGDVGEQRITRIDLDELSVVVNKFKPLVRQIALEAGFNPDVDVDNDALDAITVATGDPALGWYVRNETGRDRLLTLFAHSLASTVWGGIDGKIHAAMLTLPGQPASGEYLELGPERSMGPSVSVTDEAEDLRTRVYAAQNIDPLSPNETAGVTETWPETERQKVLADWRITAVADFERIEAGTDWPITPPLAVVSLSPSSGEASGGESVTITGRSFNSAENPVVWFGSQPATNVVVVNSSTITCDTPEEKELSVDSVSPSTGAETGGESVTITGTGFASGSVVKFGAKEATNVVVVNDTTITCDTPAE